MPCCAMLKTGTYIVMSCRGNRPAPNHNKGVANMNYRKRTFANAGSALRAASDRNPRNLPCPTCKQPDRLTHADKAKGYQCDDCANAAEGTGY